MNEKLLSLVEKKPVYKAFDGMNEKKNFSKKSLEINIFDECEQRHQTEVNEWRCIICSLQLYSNACNVLNDA